MKKCILLFLAFSFSAMAQTVGLNQSYIILDTGEAMTVRSYFPDETIVRLFKPEGFFFNPEEIEERKSNYIIDKEDNIYTISADGYMFKNTNFKLDSGIKTLGETFIITKKGSVYVIKNDGSIYYNSYENREKKLKAKVAGGNFIITNNDELILVNSIDGQLYPTNKEVIAKEVKLVSNNYFTLEDGTLFTLGFTKNEDGTFQEQVAIFNNGIGNKIRLAGGNFFFDNRNFLHTISFTGYYNLGNADRQIRVQVSLDNVDRSMESARYLGGNYFIYPDGAVYVVDHNGYFYHLDSISPRIYFSNK